MGRTTHTKRTQQTHYGWPYHFDLSSGAQYHSKEKASNNQSVNNDDTVVMRIKISVVKAEEKQVAQMLAHVDFKKIQKKVPRKYP